MPMSQLWPWRTDKADATLKAASKYTHTVVLYCVDIVAIIRKSGATENAGLENAGLENAGT